MTDPDRPRSRTDRTIQLAVALALVGTALAFDPIGGEIAPRFAAPKAFCLGLAGLLAAASLLRGPFVLETFDILAAAYFAGGLVSAALAAPSFRMSAEALAPELAAFFLLGGVRAASASPRFRTWGLTILVLTASAVALLVLAEGLGALLFEETMRRPGATFGNRNFAAAFVAVSLPIAALRFAERRPWIAAVPIFVGTIAVVLSRCRSVWLGLGLALLVGAAALALRCGRRSARPLAVTLAVVIAAVAVAAWVPWPGLAWRDDAPYLRSLTTMVESDRGSAKGRVDHVRIGLALIADAPMMGGGPGTWADRATGRAHVIAGSHAPPRGMQPSPQSDWLRVATDNGLLGLVLIIALTGLVLVKVRRRIGERPAEGCAVLAALVVTGVHSVFDAPFFRPEGLAALAVLVGTLGRSRPRVSVSGRASRAILVGLAACTAASLGLRLASAVLAHPGASANRLDLSFRLHPGTDVGTRRVRARPCGEDSLAAADEVLALGPHRWGVLRLAEACARRIGKTELADEYRRRALAVEPHLEELHAARRRGRPPAGPPLPRRISR